MRKLLGTTVGLLAPLLVASPASAEDGLPVPALPVPAGYDGPPVYGLWPHADGEVPTVLVYTRADRRWGVQRMVNGWNESGALRLVLTSTPCTGCITVSQTRAATPFGEDIGSWLGASAVNSVGGVMQHCDIMMNRSVFMPQWAAGRRSIVAHEFGHCLGLGHSTRLYSAVGKMSGLDGPTWRDLEWIQQLYGA